MTLLLNPHRFGVSAPPPLGAVQELLAFAPDPLTEEMKGIVTGVGDLSYIHTSTNYAKDYQGIYQPFDADVPIWQGGRVEKNNFELPFASWNEDYFIGLKSRVAAPGIGPNGEDGWVMTYALGINASISYRKTLENPVIGDTILQRWMVRLSEPIKIRWGFGNANVDSDAIIPANVWTDISQHVEVMATGLFYWGFGSYENVQEDFTIEVIEDHYLMQITTGNPDVTRASSYLKADETKTFYTTNENTVTDNIVTENPGIPLPDMPSLYLHQDATNSLLYSNDQTQAEWTATNATVTRDQIGLTNQPNTATLITATAANATVMADVVTAAEGTHSSKWWIKRVTGTGGVDITLDNGATWTAVDFALFDDSVAIDQTNLTNPSVGIRVQTSGDQVVIGNAELHLNTLAEGL